MNQPLFLPIRARQALIPLQSNIAPRHDEITLQPSPIPCIMHFDTRARLATMFARFKILLAKWIAPSVAQHHHDGCPFDPVELARLIKRGRRSDFQHIARVFSVQNKVPPAGPLVRRDDGRSRLPSGR
ncbi:hypothetical protein [Bradyrhizobium prioriisuperbiae]|uniref:hypothetical protein n=1 Tax=Bradyrhizobium prioriisuperbiae TaxID=2854389 RepID=UPI0028EFF236|nr:hypothetical protein [Bradyrhizobium prioritasuperba]